MASEATDSKEKMATSLEANMLYMNKVIKADKNFDVIYRVIQVGGKNACIYLIDGFCKDEMMQKLLQHFMDITEDNMPKDAHEMSKGFVPYVEVDLKDTWEEILYSLMSGVFLLFVDGFDKCILPEVWRNRKKTRYSGDPRMALWKPSSLIRRSSEEESVPQIW